MAGRDRNTRIEPTFDGPSRSRGSSGLSVREEDRVVPSNRKTSATRKSSKARASKNSRRKRGLFSRFGRLFYWTLVLGLWGGIGLAGIVAYYGAQMPSATTWAIPDRPPNVKIVSAER